MKRTIRYLFGTAILLAGAIYGYQQGLSDVWTTVGVLTCLFGGPLVALGPEIYGQLSVNLPGDAGVNFGDDDDCTHNKGDQK